MIVHHIVKVEEGNALGLGHINAKFIVTPDTPLEVDIILSFQFFII